MRVSILLLAMVLWIPAAAVRAQAPEALEPGDRIRLRIVPEADAEDRWIEGELLSVTGDSITLRLNTASSPLMVAIESVDRIERRAAAHTRGSQILRGALAGALVGGSEFPLRSFESEPRVGRQLMIGAGLGAALGTILGAFLPVDGWERMPVPGRDSTFASARRMPRLGLAAGPAYAEAEIGSGSGGHAHITVGLFRLLDEAIVRAEFAYQWSSTSGRSEGCVYQSSNCVLREEAARRYGAGLTLIGPIRRLGERGSVYVPMGVGIFRSRVETADEYPRAACPGSTACTLQGSAGRQQLEREAVGASAFFGLGTTLRFGDVDMFTEFRVQLVDTGADEASPFAPLVVGVAF